MEIDTGVLRIWDRRSRLLVKVHRSPNRLYVLQLWSKVEIDIGVPRIWDQRGRLLVKVRCGPNNLYVLQLEAAQLLCLPVRGDDEAWRWHERLCQLHFEGLMLGKEAMARRLQVINHVHQLYDTCVTTKQKRRPFPRQALYHVEAA